MKEALKLALEALEEIHVGNMTPMAEINWNKAITAIKEALAPTSTLCEVQPEQGPLAKVEPCAVCGEGKARLLVLRSCDTCHSEYAGQAEMKVALGRPEQEPVAWATREDFYRELDRRIERIRKEMEIKTVTMRCEGYDVALTIIDAHFGNVLVGQVSASPKRPWVGLTQKEIQDIHDTYHKRMGPQEFARAIEAKLKELNT